ncbi:hypothetical protein EGW08_005175 [Elysia chlorotica]|uniref:Uncharacterized protein n=1 Tax=Elysia chlorotica TaxID=188477 RepID=A0A433TZU2_ELYCH|nr:hypothetical protein EGW08_005175 [Elysia chlorotica]
MGRYDKKYSKGHAERSAERGGNVNHSRNFYKAFRGRKQGLSSNSSDQEGPTSSARLPEIAPSSSTSSTSTCDKSESDIPGFYYDKEKRAYFKILPNTMSAVSSFVTKESIKEKENEIRRLSDVTRFLQGQSAVLRSALFKPSESAGLAEVLRKFQCGQVTCENFRSYWNRHQCTTLQPDVEITSSGFSQDSPKVDSIQKMLATKTHDHLVCVWSLKSSIAQCIQLLSVSGKLKRYSKPKLGRTETTDISKVIQTVVMTQPISRKISSLCWAKFPNCVSGPTILYAATCPIGYSPTIVHANNFDSATNSIISIYELNLGFSTVWSCAWHNHDAKFSIGTERKCLLIDVATRRTWTYHTHNSDPLSQAFSLVNPHKMFNGTRGGSIVVHDIRCPGKVRSQQEMRQKHGISCLKLLEDENYIMANDFSGGIMTWDQRMSRIVRKYEGLVNSHYQLPFHLDEQELVVCGAGSDSYSKLWDVRSGSLLQNIPPPYPASPDSLPIAMYAQAWGNSPGNTGLVMAIKNGFKIYS